jgi:hypothetical protein
MKAFKKIQQFTSSNAFKKLRLTSYNKAPEYEAKSEYHNKSNLDNLLLMRDLRLWVIENVPHSQQVNKYYSDIEHINKEIQFLELKSNLKLFFRLFLYYNQFFLYL